MEEIGVHTHYQVAMIVIFFIGYALIAFEHVVQINKSTTALLMAILCWIIQFANKGMTGEENTTFLGIHVANISQVIFFLIGAIAIVEIIDAHKGFRLISNNINVSSKRKLLWLLGFLGFFLSSVLDNLTTTILLVSLVKKIIYDEGDRLLIGGGIVIAANAGGAWTPIGDITTTMLWIGGQVSTVSIMKSLFFPSLACLCASFACLTFMLKGDFEAKKVLSIEEDRLEPMGEVIFFLGIGALISVPIFKLLTGLPPFMGILFGLSILWLVTDIMHYKYSERQHLRVTSVMSRIDLSGAMFFLGILLCITSLETAGILEMLAHWLDKNIGNVNVIAVLIGLASAIVDNVPLVAASMGMYSLEQFATDSVFWQLVAYCAGTGGSILVIGSAAGVAFMGLEKVDFLWYVKKISLPALVGYFVGLIIYLVS
jgi:NhaD family Na+/H+ antiporter